jgi:hypothetical protein
VGRAGALGSERQREKEGQRRPRACGLRRKRRRWACWAERKRKGEREGFWEFSFFFNSFQTFFKLCKLHSNNKTMHSNHDAHALIVSNIIEMIFKYLKAKFI